MPTAAAPAAAAAAPEAPPDDLLQAFAFSPPFFVAWSLGYLSDARMLACLFVMALPWCTRRGVQYLGGRGAWAKEAPPAEPPTAKQAAVAAAAAAANNSSSLAEAMRLPLSVWLPSMMLMGLASRDAGTTDLQYMTSTGLTMLAVYCILVAANLVSIKMGLTGKKAEAAAAAAAAAAAKAKKKKK